MARTQLVNNFMKANGIDPNANLNTGYLPSQVTEELRQQASVAWLGQRSTAIFNVYQTQAQEPAAGMLNPDDDFSGGNVIQLAWLRRHLVASPDATSRRSSLNFDQSQSGESVGTQETTLRSA